VSLVNKMLRDLDARHIGENERAALPAAVTPLAARQEQGSRLTAVWGTLIVILALAAVMAWQEFGSDTPVAKVAPALVTPVTPIAPEPVAASTPPVPQGPAPNPAAEPVAVPSPGAAPVFASAVASSAPAVPVQSNDAVLPSSTLRMAAELSLIPPPAPTPAPKLATPSVPRPAADKPVVATARVAEKPVPEKASAGPQPALEPAAKPAPVAAEVRIEKQDRVTSAAERAESEFRRAAAAQRQGNANAALAGYRSALEQHPEHAGARQALAARLIDAGRYDEAEEVLRRGIEIAPVRLASTMALARLKVEQNKAAAALELLQKNAASGEGSAEYQGFTGALLNRAGRSAEAAERYRQAARLAPGEGRWWAGLGIALDASGKSAEAREAYQRARQSPDLPTDLALHVEQRLR
jgi:MSHA biogenesis protein MshN